MVDGDGAQCPAGRSQATNGDDSYLFKLRKFIDSVQEKGDAKPCIAVSLLEDAKTEEDIHAIKILCTTSYAGNSLRDPDHALIENLS